MCISLYMSMRMVMSVRMYMHVCKCMRVYVRICLCMSTYNPYVHVHVYICVNWTLGGASFSGPNWEIVSFRSCVRAGEAKLCARILK